MPLMRHLAPIAAWPEAAVGFDAQQTMNRLGARLTELGARPVLKVPACELPVDPAGLLAAAWDGGLTVTTWPADHLAGRGGFEDVDADKSARLLRR